MIAVQIFFNSFPDAAFFGVDILNFFYTHIFLVLFFIVPDH